MAYVVRRRHGRFEIRESIHTPGGPRARTLASFSVLTDAVLAAAAGRAERPFDAARVRASADRQGAPISTAGSGPSGARPSARIGQPYVRFVESARRMADSLSPPSAGRRDAGEALIDLLGFAEQVVMSQGAHLGDLVSKIVRVHEMLESMRVPHQFGGAIALAWYRNPRATTDIDLNVTVPPEEAGPVLGALAHLGVAISDADRALIARDGQARLRWDGSYLDVFFATLDLHHEMAGAAQRVSFGPVVIPILSPEHLIVCKAVFDRPKDWVDIGEIVGWGTPVDREAALGWVGRILGTDSEQSSRLAELLPGG